LLQATAGVTGAGPISATPTADDGHPFTGTRVRIARPTDRLDDVVQFYAGALGLPVLRRFHTGGYSGVLLGLPETQVHLEFTHEENGSPCPAPTQDNLLVIYFDDHGKYSQVLEQVKSHGHAPVTPLNPYWAEGRSETFQDPDGWRVVLYHGTPVGGGY